MGMLRAGWLERSEDGGSLIGLLEQRSDFIANGLFVKAGFFIDY
jgi:hypothetical protein